MKDELNFSYNGGRVVYLLQSGAIRFNLTVQRTESTIEHDSGAKLNEEICTQYACE